MVRQKYFINKPEFQNYMRKHYIACLFRVPTLSSLLSSGIYFLFYHPTISVLTSKISLTSLCFTSNLSHIYALCF